VAVWSQNRFLRAIASKSDFPFQTHALVNERTAVGRLERRASVRMHKGTLQHFDLR